MAIRMNLRERLLVGMNKLPVPVLDSFVNVLFGRSLMVCNSYGIFDHLQTSSQTPEELAVKAGISAKGAELLLQTMEAGGYVLRTGNRYRNSRAAKRWLSKSSPQYIGDLVRYFDTLYSRWQFLGGSVRDGKPRKPYFEYFTGEDWEIYVHGMMNLARILMPEVLRAVSLPPSSRRLLDLGGSHGLYSVEFCRRHPELSAVVVDFQEAVEVGRKITREFNMSERVLHRAANFITNEIGSGYDAVLAFNIIHGLTVAENISLLKKISAALNSGGKVVIMDQLRNGEGTSQLSRLISVIVGINIFNEIGGNAYTFKEIKEWCGTAGFVQCRMKSLRVPGVAIIQAKKSA